ncbi:MAG: hypothetical protein LBP22_08425 [Deltaproteobacteria bacterium]|nr:hypothetical protein [Deltaproteobacteria bacterium]
MYQLNRLAVTSGSEAVGLGPKEYLGFEPETWSGLMCWKTSGSAFTPDERPRTYGSFNGPKAHGPAAVS